MDFWHPVLLGKNVLFEESPPSIMVTRNPDWSAKILWYETGYAKGRYYHPLNILALVNIQLRILPTLMLVNITQL